MKDSLRALAVEKGIISKYITHEYLERNFQEKRTIIMWILSERSTKVFVIDSFKKMLRKEKGIRIRKPSDYYVDQINDVLYKSIAGGKTRFITAKKGLEILFETIAQLWKGTTMMVVAEVK
jgi:hypothetical protein